MIGKQLQKNCYGAFGVGAFTACVMNAINGDYELAIILGSIAPSLLALRSGIVDNEEIYRAMDERVTDIYQTIEFNERAFDSQIEGLEREIEKNIDNTVS